MGYSTYRESFREQVSRRAFNSDEGRQSLKNCAAIGWSTELEVDRTRYLK